MKGSRQGKLSVYPNLPVFHRLRHGRVAHQDGAADREASVADTSYVYEVSKTDPGSIRTRVRTTLQVFPPSTLL